jgi:hypothetical protein
VPNISLEDRLYPRLCRGGTSNDGASFLWGRQRSEGPEGVGRLGNPSRKLVACPEGRKRLGHASRVLNLHEVCSAGQDEPFAVR